jgi:hypothetical protein
MIEFVDSERASQIKNFGCEVDEVSYNLLKQVGHVHMPEGNCTDMDSTIKYFQNQVPDICHIITWCDGELDTQYIDHAGDGNWIAI